MERFFQRDSSKAAPARADAALCSPEPVTWPTLNVTTYNINGTSVTNPQRNRCITRNIDHLLKSAHVLCLQEVKLDYKNTNALSRPRNITYYNNKTRNSAGTAVLVRRELLKDYKVENLKLPLPLRGHVQALVLRPYDHSATRGSVLVINLYLNAHSDATRTAQLMLAHDSIAPEDYNYVLGDYNYVNKSEDSSTEIWRSPASQPLLAAWGKMEKKFDLKEHVQRRHTYFQISLKTPEVTTTSRIDRIYSSHSEVESSIREPSAAIETVPYSILKRYFKSSMTQEEIKTKRGIYSSDHLPLGLKFRDTKRTSSANSIPHWIATDSLFPRLFAVRWWAHDRHVPPEREMERFKLAAYSAAKAVRRRHRNHNNNQADNLDKLVMATALLRLTATREPDVIKVEKQRAKFPDLAGLVSFDKNTAAYDSTRLKKYIGEILTSSTSIEEEKDDARPPTPLPIRTRLEQVKREDLAKTLKLLLPSARKRLRALRRKAEDEPTSDPEKMAGIAKEFWDTVWGRDDLGGKGIWEYLGEKQEIREELLQSSQTNKTSSMRSYTPTTRRPGRMAFLLWFTVSWRSTPPPS